MGNRWTFNCLAAARRHGWLPRWVRFGDSSGFANSTGCSSQTDREHLSSTGCPCSPSTHSLSAERRLCLGIRVLWEGNSMEKDPQGLLPFAGRPGQGFGRQGHFCSICCWRQRWHRAPALLPWVLPALGQLGGESIPCFGPKEKPSAKHEGKVTERFPACWPHIPLPLSNQLFN